MGFFDKLKEKKDEIESKKKEEVEAAQPEGKYSEPCALCGGVGTEKKWMGQYWHRKCVRSAKRASKKML